MKKLYLYLAFFTLFLLLSVSNCFAENSLDVVINEIAWMGTSVSYNDEWIELYNNTDSSLNLAGWMLKSSDGTPEIKLVGIVTANGFYLLERTDDNTLPGILADQIYTGALGNNGENLGLYDNLGNLIDLVDCSASWFAGDNTTKQTMERKNPQIAGKDINSWQTSQSSEGTPKAINSQQITINNEEEIKSEEPKIIDEIQPQSTGETNKSYPSGVFINEILPSPKGADSEEEWIEIFNKNDFEVDLSGWKISDTAGKTTTFIFPAATKISAKGFLVLNRPTTKITLNNDGDTLNIVQPDGNIIDMVSFEKAPIGQSYNKIENSWIWSDNLTPGSENNIPKEEPEKESQTENEKEKGLAAVSELFNKENQSGERTIKFSLIIVAALVIAILSGLIILFLRKRLKPGN